MKPPYAIGSVPSLSGHAIAYRWRSLPRVHRHRASKPQGSSERVLPWQITMDRLIFASLSHTHYWYEVGMLKVPAWGWGGVKTFRWNHRLQKQISHSAYWMPTRKNYLTRWLIPLARFLLKRAKKKKKVWQHTLPPPPTLLVINNSTNRRK